MAKMVAVRESRVRTERTSDGLRIDVARRMSFFRALIPVWGGMILVFALVGFLSSDTPDYDAGAIVFLVVWFGIVISAIALSLWGLLYRERLLLDARALTHRRWLGPIRRERGYARDRIEDVRVSAESMFSFDPRSSFRMIGIGAGTVAFDYGDRTYRVADVDEAEAKRVVAALAEEGLR